MPVSARHLVAVNLLCLAACAHHDRGVPPPSDSPEMVAADMWEISLSDNPVRATLLGDRRFDASLPDLSVSARHEAAHKYDELLRRLQTLNPAYIRPDSWLTARTLAIELQNVLDRRVCAFASWRVDPVEGYHLGLLRLAESQVIDDSAAATAYLTRLGGVAALLEQHAQNLQAGLAKGLSTPQVVVRRVLAQLDALPEAALSQKFGLPVRRAQNLGQGDTKALQADVAATVHTQIAPAYAAYARFLRDVYLPAARHALSLAEHAQGARCYQAVFSQYAAMAQGQTPAELHALARDELDRLQEAMRAVAQTQGFTTSAAYADQLATDPAQHVESKQALVAQVETIVARARDALPTAFATMPSIALQVRPVGTYQERDAPLGFYVEGASDGSRPATFFINAYQANRRPWWHLEALTFHETLPGHHLQMALAQKVSGLPALRRHAMVPNFFEGWALYAEALADELHLYSGPASRFGRLHLAAMRAARTVIDTGVHAMGWTREQAVAFMRDNLLMGNSEIENEVDRDAIWPGQALAYTSGYLSLLNLRDQAQRKLGADFDMHAFHAHVLGQGALPMPVLRDVIGMWLARLPPGPPSQRDSHPERPSP